MSTIISGTNGVTFPDSTSMQTGQQACKAWVNFNGTGTVAIRGSYNVSSITDNAVGDYTVNFTTAMADANYSAVGATTNGGESSYDKGDFMFTGTTSYFATDSLRFHIEGRFSRYDLPIVTVTIFSN